ncbi:MAG: ATP-binding cassette domain-containing protein [Actinomycetota bacterium]
MVERPAIRARGLTKFYGAQRGIEDLDLDVLPGETFGFLGPNGAGKTTTIRVLLDLLRPTRGSVSIFGVDSRDASARARTGYLPGELRLYDNLTGEEMLRFSASLRGGVDWGRVSKLADRFDCDLSLKISSLSHGNRQKVGLINAVMHDPDLLLLDEPTQGLDPLMQRAFFDLMADLAAEGKTVFMSSHVLPEIERTCTRVAMVREGFLVTVERIEDLRERTAHTIEVRFAAPVPAERFQNLDGVKDVQVEGPVLRCLISTTPDALIKAAAGYTVLDIISHEPSLEDVFMSFYGGEGPRAS